MHCFPPPPSTTPPLCQLAAAALIGYLGYQLYRQLRDDGRLPDWLDFGDFDQSARPDRTDIVS